MSKCFPLFLFPQAHLPRETVNPQWRRQMGPCHFSDFLILFPAWKRHIPTHLRQWPQNGDRGCQVSLPCQRPHFPFLEFPFCSFFFFLTTCLVSSQWPTFAYVVRSFILLKNLHTLIFKPSSDCSVACSPGAGTHSCTRSSLNVLTQSASCMGTSILGGPEHPRCRGPSAVVRGRAFCRGVASTCSSGVSPRPNLHFSPQRSWGVNMNSIHPELALQNQEPTAESRCPLGCPIHGSDSICQTPTSRRGLHRPSPLLSPLETLPLHPPHRSGLECHLPLVSKAFPCF